MRKVLASGILPTICAVVVTLAVYPRAQNVRFVRSQLTWYDRAGKKLGIIGNLADYGNVELSPDETRIAVGVLADIQSPTRDIWLVDVATGRHTSFTADPTDENWAIWSRDGRSLVFNSGRNGGLDLYQADAKSPGAVSGMALLVDRDAKWPVSWSTDGRYILYVTSGERPGNHIIVLPMFGDRKPVPYMRTENNNENWAAFSPDGKWIAFSSTESGQAEVYVAPFPEVPRGRKRLVSQTGGGSQARWRRDGTELYFLDADRRIVAAPVSVKGTELEIGELKRLFEARFPYGNYHAFDVTSDGQRFLVNTLVTSPGSVSAGH